MNAFTHASPDISFAPASALFCKSSAGYPAVAFHSRCGIAEADARTHPGTEFIRGEPTATDLDLLVTDIATLARPYMNRGALDAIAPALAAPGIPGHPGSTVRIHAIGSDAAGSGQDADEELLGAVCSLLGSALQKMRTSAGERVDANIEPIAPPRPRGGIAPSALRRVREHIDRNLGEHIEIADLAALTGLSPCHFSRAFKQSMGVPPHRYLISRRVQAAARLIETTDRPLFEIALDVGFSDQSHFTRFFSAQVGESPSQYRHQRR